jgi:intracellular sulfur oxidation DsrE/DsrF family protein
MKIRELLHIKSSIVFVCLLFITNLALATNDYYDESVPPQPKAFYDINLTNPGTMRDFLGVIDLTYDLLINKGAPSEKIKFVVSLRGLSVKFATNGFGIGTPDEQVGMEIRDLLNTLLDKGVRIEACIISCVWVGVDPQDLIDGILVIDNAFASSIWYQTKGYALIPIHQLP